MKSNFDKIPESVRAEAIRTANLPHLAWGSVFVNYDTDFQEWFVNPFRCNGEEGCFSIGMIDPSTKTLVPA